MLRVLPIQALLSQMALKYSSKTNMKYQGVGTRRGGINSLGTCTNPGSTGQDPLPERGGGHRDVTPPVLLGGTQVPLPLGPGMLQLPQDAGEPQIAQHRQEGSTTLSSTPGCSHGPTPPSTHRPAPLCPPHCQEPQQPRALQKSQFYFRSETTNQEERKSNQNQTQNKLQRMRNGPKSEPVRCPGGCYIQAGGLGGAGPGRHRLPGLGVAPALFGRGGRLKVHQAGGQRCPPTLRWGN